MVSECIPRNNTNVAIIVRVLNACNNPCVLPGENNVYEEICSKISRHVVYRTIFANSRKCRRGCDSGVKHDSITRRNDNDLTFKQFIDIEKEKQVLTLQFLKSSFLHENETKMNSFMENTGSNKKGVGKGKQKSNNRRRIWLSIIVSAD